MSSRRKSKSSSSEYDEREYTLRQPFGSSAEREKYYDSEFESLNLDALKNEREYLQSIEEDSSFSFFAACFPCWFGTEKPDNPVRDGYYRGSMYDDTELSEMTDGKIQRYPDLTVVKRSSDQPYDDEEELEFDIDASPFDSSREIEEKPPPAPSTPPKPIPIPIPIKSTHINLMQVAREPISSDDDDDDNDMKEPSIESEEDTTIEASKITPDCIPLTNVDLKHMTALLIVIDKEITEYKAMNREFEKMMIRRKENNKPNRLRIERIGRILMWIDNGKQCILEFKKNVEKKKNDADFYLSENLDKFIDFYIDFFKSRYITQFLRDEKDSRLLPPHPSLPHIMYLKNNH